MISADTEPTSTRQPAQLAGLVLAAFLLTFAVARLIVYLIYARIVPALYLHVNGTHVHHLNYGIFLLALISGFLILVRPQGKLLSGVALLYGVAMALTFDEFGMWLNLGGGYWQRVSFQAVGLIALLLGFVAAMPHLKRVRPGHWATIGATAVVVLTLATVPRQTVRSLARWVHPAPRGTGTVVEQVVNVERH